jgi:hypothetical protein
VWNRGGTRIERSQLKAEIEFCQLPENFLKIILV